MDPLTILNIVQTGLTLLAKFGPPAFTAFLALFQPAADGTPTAAQWQALLASTQITARDQMLTTLKAHNIDPASPEGLAFLALTPA